MGTKTRQEYTAEANKSFKRKVITYHESHPDMTLKAIGRVFKLSKQRIWQILQEAKNNGQ